MVMTLLFGLFYSLLLLLLHTSSTSEIARFGYRIDARTLTKQQFQDLYDGSWPVILTNVFPLDNDEWCKDLLETCGSSTIDYDVRHSATGEIESYQATLSEFLGAIEEQSDHDENIYLMTEDLLQQAPVSLKSSLKHPDWLFDKDLFAHFPTAVRPQQALIVGGQGARSFLHRDPYEWMGTNYLLEGRKLWTFFTPDVPSTLFRARRNAPDAWGMYNISAGWVSDIDLYRHRQSIPLGALVSYASKKQSEDVLSVRRDTTEDIEGGKKKGRKSTSGSSTKNQGLEQLIQSTLTHVWLSHAMTTLSSSNDGMSTSITDSSNDNEDIRAIRRNLNVPIFLSGEAHLDFACTDQRLAKGALQMVQEAGELIIIPPNFWHQVYHLEPSIAVASQYMNNKGKFRVFSHMLHWSDNTATADEISVLEGVGESSKSAVSSCYDRTCPQWKLHPLLHAESELANINDEEKQVQAVIRTSLALQHGSKEGSLLAKQLQLNDNR